MAYSVVLSFSLIWRRIPLTEGRKVSPPAPLSVVFTDFVLLNFPRNPAFRHFDSQAKLNAINHGLRQCFDRYYSCDKKNASCGLHYDSLPGDIRRRYDQKTSEIKREICTALQRKEFSNRKDWPDVNYIDVVDIWFLTSPATRKSSLSIASLWMPTGFCNMAGWGKFCTWSSRAITWHALRLGNTHCRFNG